MQEIGIKSSSLDDILNGNKTIEGRLGKARFLKIQSGDILSIRKDIWQGDKITKSYSDVARIYIKQVLYFESFEEMLSALDFEAAVPTADNTNEAVKFYRQFHTVKDEQDYGVVSMLFELI